MYKHILVAIDGSETSARAFNTALQLALESDAVLQPLYVVDAPLMAYNAPGYDPSILRTAFLEEGERLMTDALARMKQDGIPGASRIIEVNPIGDGIAQRILLAAADIKADLVVMGTHGRRGFQRLVLGSVAERFVRMANCPVLLVPANHMPPVSAPTGNISGTTSETSSTASLPAPDAGKT